ncbi:MAG: hypothetical protein LJE91_02480 [Gammaproteobacteria bacterium]|nr:hypothetical protein [Gammaproteobacteria bacterium]
MKKTIDETGRRRTVQKCFQAVQIGHDELHHSRQIRRIPVSVDVTLGESEITAGEESPKRLVIQDIDLRHRARLPALEMAGLTVRQANRQYAAPKMPPDMHQHLHRGAIGPSGANDPGGLVG